MGNIFDGPAAELIQYENIPPAAIKVFVKGVPYGMAAMVVLEEDPSISGWYLFQYLPKAPFQFVAQYAAIQAALCSILDSNRISDGQVIVLISNLSAVVKALSRLNPGSSNVVDVQKIVPLIKQAVARRHQVQIAHLSGNSEVVWNRAVGFMARRTANKPALTNLGQKDFPPLPGSMRRELKL